MKTITLKTIATFILAIVFLSYVSCERHGKAWESMDMAEEVMNSQPDSALSLLNSIQAGSLDSKKKKARYALLKSMALDKNVVDTTEFDVLQPAIDYYLKKGSPDERLRTCYYQGRIYQNRGDNDSAMYSFLRGREFFSEAKDTMTIANLMVAQATIQYMMYKFDDYITNNIDAAHLYGAVDRSDYEVSCLANAMDGCVIDVDKSKADSILDIIEVKIEKQPHLRDMVTPYFLRYLTEFGNKEDIVNLMNYYNSQDSIDDFDIINLATVYHKLGATYEARRMIESIGHDSEIRYSLKYLAVKAMIFETDGEFSKALDAYKAFYSSIDSLHLDLMSRDLMFAQKKHEIQRFNLIELQRKDRRIWIILSAACLFFMMAVFIYYHYRLSQAKGQLAEKECLSLLQKNERLELERKNSILEKEVAESERDRQMLESENLKMRIDQLETEGIRLKEILEEQNEMAPPLREILRTRMEMLNTLLASEISNKEKYAKPYNQWKEKLIKDKDEFMKSTRLTFTALYPNFIDYLKCHDLSESEINYLCLYAIGLRGTDVGEYTRIKRHYHISSDIRKKLGIDEHKTNIGLYVRKLLKSL